MNSYTLKQLFDTIGSRLSSIYSGNEVRAIRKLLFDKVVGIPHFNVHINPNVNVDVETATRISDILNELEQGKPVQYAIGEADFMDMIFTVNPNVLIPRPETEELVGWVVGNNKNASPKILDIGTGTGCIAIALAKYITNAQVSAIDISMEALNTAKQNAMQNNVRIDFINADILTAPTIANAPFDIIVSNPPYVREMEKQVMHRNVTEFEPHLALFVSNNDPLLFYRTITINAHRWLKKNGQLYFEINEAFGNEIKDLLIENGFKDVEVRKDLNGKDRMAFGRI